MTSSESSDGTCCILILAPTFEQGTAVVTTWKLAESQCEGSIEHKIHVCSKNELSNLKSIFNKYKGQKCTLVVTMTAESQ